jgi:hypothetical protein
MINEDTRILEHVFKNPKIEDFIKNIYNLRYEKERLTDYDIGRIIVNERFNRYDLRQLKKDIKKDTEKAISDLGEKIDKVLSSVFPKNENDSENFTRQYVLKYFLKEGSGEKIFYDVNLAQEMEKIVRMRPTDFISYIGRDDLLGDETKLINPHGAYKPKPGTENRFNIRNIQVRAKTPESLADKVIRYLSDSQKEGEQIPDLIGIRLILEEDSIEKDCYNLSNFIDQIFNNYEIIERDDNIANPKTETGYQTLKTVYSNGSCFELQIRTYDMHMKALEDKYNNNKVQNGKENFFFLLLENLFSARYN